MKLLYLSILSFFFITTSALALHRISFPEKTIVVAQGPNASLVGDLPGLPASGRSSTITGIGIDRIEGGKIAETWGNWDTLGMMQQLGAVPAAAAAS